MKRTYLSAALAASVLAVVAPAALAEIISLDGYYDCARATNGHAYCKREGQGDHYFSVTDPFLARYLAEVTNHAAPPPAAVVAPAVVAPVVVAPVVAATTTTMNVTNNVVIALKNDASDIRGLVTLFHGMIDEQKKIVAPDQSDVAQQTVAVLSDRIRELEGQYQEKATQLSGYGTPIRPTDEDLKMTARRASELFPKIPYYIPGTPDTGEFWLEPTVSDVGQLVFNLKFIDPKSKDAVREMVSLTSGQLELTRTALRKVADWSKTAHDKGIRKEFAKRAICFPAENCAKEDGAKIENVASTEIIFRIYENGSTAGRIQHNKGRYESGYNISVESSLLLQAYLNHVLQEGKKEFDAGTASKAQLDASFQ